MNSKKHVLRRLLIVSIALATAGGVWFAAYNKPRPKSVAGPEAEAVARQMLMSVNAEAWKATGAVRFTFRDHRHLWDRHRGYDRIEYGSHTVLLRIRDQSGRAWHNGNEADAARSAELIRKAYAHWVNDSFWLNPVVKIFDRGVTRGVVREEAEDLQLLVEYSSGGVTPGDAYLWLPGANGAPPTQWRMWASNLPVGGLAASWEGWTTLSTGAKVATLHRIGPFRLELKDVAGASTLRSLPGISQDPFVPLLQ